jgi:hypothetical protein
MQCDSHGGFISLVGDGPVCDAGPDERFPFSCLACLVKGAHQGHKADDEDTDCCPPRTALRPFTRRKLRLTVLTGCLFGLLASFYESALSVGDLGRSRVASGYPSIRQINLVPAQKQRFRASASVPAPREFSVSCVLANPVKVDPQRFGELE